MHDEEDMRLKYTDTDSQSGTQFHPVARAAYFFVTGVVSPVQLTFILSCTQWQRSPVGQELLLLYPYNH
jgi:hypothetical protein